MQEASAQCTALPTAQLPAQLAASLLQAAFQALILLQGTREEGGEKNKLLGALGRRWEDPEARPNSPNPISHIRSLWSRSRTSSSRWFTSDTSSSSKSCSRCCCAVVFSQSGDGGG